MSRIRAFVVVTCFAGSAVALAADDVPGIGPGSQAHKDLLQHCGRMPSESRGKCMLDAQAADEKSGKHCELLTLRAREQCLADSQATQQQQAADQAAGGPPAGASTGGLSTPQTASPGKELQRQ
jgi:hypothetical protein